jgi:flagellar biosynthetic protein FliQ
MNPETAVEIIKALILTSVTLASPILLTALTIGMGISVFQAVTSIQEQTLSFVPKALAVLSLIVVTLPWMVRTTLEFTRSVIEQIPQMVG